jgi:hypothetical protein
MAEAAIEAFTNGNRDSAIVSTGATGEGWRVGQANGIVKGETGKAARFMASDDALMIQDTLRELSATLVWGTTTKGNDGALDLPEGHKAVTVVCKAI